MSSGLPLQLELGQLGSLENELFEMYQDLDQFIKLLIQQIQSSNSLYQEVKRTYDDLGSKVEVICETYLKTMRELQIVFIRLREIKVEDCFCENLQDIDHKTRTQTLFDWVPIEEVHKMQNEAYSELAAMQKLGSYLRKTGSKLEKEHENIANLSKFLYSNDYVISNLNQKSELHNVEWNELNYVLGEIIDTEEKIRKALNNPSSITPEITSKFQEKTKQLSLSVSQIPQKIKIPQTIYQEMEQWSKIHSPTFQKAHLIIELLHLFGLGCYKTSKTFKHYEIMYKEHHDGYKHLFEQLGRLTQFYDQFSTSYDNMLLEISRRKKFITTQQIMVERFQKELDNLYTEEMIQREKFEKNYGDFLPSNMCPALSEKLPYRRIYPEVFYSSLPQISKDDSNAHSIPLPLPLYTQMPSYIQNLSQSLPHQNNTPSLIPTRAQSLPREATKLQNS
eukprot:TRINITY_DN8990_c0_g1_i2.p1 TRINITY_DN8990_c0_g1~~TRINITY_DN8990_c0_g1_i2.p1  ORF type:complete len:449 (+),score=124.33 TRINITY_DN8990_c0_g1_i2:78-1424(+)